MLCLSIKPQSNIDFFGNKLNHQTKRNNENEEGLLMRYAERLNFDIYAIQRMKDS